MLREIAHDGLVLRLRDEGPRSGDVVLLLHGFPQDCACWDEVVPALHRRGLRTLALDQRGYSPTAIPADLSGYRLAVLAADAVAVLDAVGVRHAHVVGHDWGGAVAWRLGARHAGRVASLTVLSTPHPTAFAWAMTRSSQPWLSWYTVAVQVPALPELLLARSLEPVLRLSGLAAEPARRYADRLSRPASLHGPLGWYRAAARRPPWELLAVGGASRDEVKVPTTYVWGRRDPALGRAAAERTREYVSGDYLFVELDAGHWLPEMHPDAVAEAVIDRVEHAA